MQGNRVTFMRPDQASPHWTGVPPAEEAAPAAILAYFRAYGPATIANFRSFVSRGGIGTRRMRAWFSAVGDRLTEIEVDGEPALIVADDLEQLAATRPRNAVRLLPGFDQYVMGPGTDDLHVVPPGRRKMVSKQSGWIAPTVLAGGVVRGTWEVDRDTARIAWFTEAGPPPRDALATEVARLSSILGRRLEIEIQLI